MELRSELKENEFILDDAATEEQRLDLNLVDGLLLVMGLTDEGEYDSFESNWEIELNRILAESEIGNGGDCVLDRVKFEKHLGELEKIITPFCDRKADLALLRDFMKDLETNEDTNESMEINGEDVKGSSVQCKRTSKIEGSDDRVGREQIKLQDSFLQCVDTYRALLVKHGISTLKSSWDTLTAIADVDVDRAAVKDDSSSIGSISSFSQQQLPPQFLPLSKVNNVVRSYASKSCVEQIKSIWKLLDRDDDSFLEEEEVSVVIELGLKPVKGALLEFVDMALEASPVRNFSLPVNMGNAEGISSVKPSWRQKRQEKKTKKELQKMFKKTTGRHFEIEVEVPHRLRCIYSWADKIHQDGKVQSILVDSGGGDGAGASIIGRKRYVELKPKISYEEFRCMQREHFSHCDRIGTEILSSYREDLLVSQGIGRQNAELRREAFGFLTVVSLIDAGILML